MNHQDEPLVAEVVDAPRRNVWLGLADNTWVLCATLFFAMGVLGVPLIFYNTKLSFPQKIALAVAVTLYTALLITAAVFAVMSGWAAYSSFRA